MRLLMLLLALSLHAEETPKLEDVQKQLAAAKAKVVWLEEKLAAVESRADALARYFQISDQIRAIDAKKPADPPVHVKDETQK